jgi:hypothetical protein
MWFAMAAAVAASYVSYASAHASASDPNPAKQQLDWERDQLRRQAARDAEARKIRRQGMYGTALLIAFALSAGYLVANTFFA